jgi:hypothetical protein
MRRLLVLTVALSLPACLLERIPPLSPIKPYIELWEKPGMTEEGRFEDWLACGGDKNGSFSADVRKKLTNENIEQTSRRQRDEFQRCLIRRGYRYTGKCSSPDMKAKPLCGAP